MFTYLSAIAQHLPLILQCAGLVLCSVSCSLCLLDPLFLICFAFICYADTYYYALFAGPRSINTGRRHPVQTRRLLSSISIKSPNF